MKKQIWYLDFNIKPVIIKKGYINIGAINNKNEIVTIENKGNKIKIKSINVYFTKEGAKERLNEYYIIKKYKATHDHVCAYCGNFITNKEELTVDHIIPKSKGGKTEDKNLCIACKDCNSKKTNIKPFKFINSELKIQINKERKNIKKIGRSLNLKADNIEYIAKRDSREWNLNFFLNKSPYKIARQLGC